MAECYAPAGPLGVPFMSDNTIRFTKRSIANLPAAPVGKRKYYQDSRVPGLRMAVTATGAKSWVLQRRVNGRVKRITLGRFPDMPPERAFKNLYATLGQLAEGIDPAADKRRKNLKRFTLEDAFEEYLKARHTLKSSTIKSYRQNIEVGLKDWRRSPLQTITKDMVADRHARLTHDSGPGYADMVMRTLKAIWNFAAGLYEDENGESILPSNPVQRLSKTRAWNRNKPRTTLIRPRQLPGWFEAVEQLRREPWPSTGKTVGDYLVLVILTGMRRSEAASLAWSQVDLKDRSLTLTDTKNRSDHTLPLSDYLYELLSARRANRADDTERFVFPGSGRTGHIVEFRTYMNRVTQQSGVTFGIHDLRRTFITIAESIGVSTYALSQLANHKLGHSITRDYIVIDHERLREPMQRITDYVLATAFASPERQQHKYHKATA